MGLGEGDPVEPRTQSCPQLPALSMHPKARPFLRQVVRVCSEAS